MAGLKAANQRGRIGGRPRAIGEKLFERASKMHESNELSVGEICSTLGINRRTFNRYLKERKISNESK
ncbi:MAG: helix-turn-helix domain-containing protein [Bacteriovorax sp.]|nr:helix-turn-helix domain-containing protein [Bacteriovorax sp.]